MAQTVKYLPAMQETQIQFLGQEDPQRIKWQHTPVFLSGEFHGQRSLMGKVHGLTKSWTQLSHTHTHTHTLTILKSVASLHLSKIENYS